MEEGGRELMVLDDKNLGLLDCAPPPVQGHQPVFSRSLQGRPSSHCGER